MKTEPNSYYNSGKRSPKANIPWRKQIKKKYFFSFFELPHQNITIKLVKNIDIDEFSLQSRTRFFLVS